MKTITLMTLAVALVVLSLEDSEAKPKPFIPFNFWLNVSRQGPPPPAPLIFTTGAFPVFNSVPVVIGPPVYIKTETRFMKDEDKKNSTSTDDSSETSSSSSSDDTTTKHSAIKGYNITTNFHTKVIPIKHDSTK